MITKELINSEVEKLRKEKWLEIQGFRWEYNNNLKITKK